MRFPSLLGLSVAAILNFAPGPVFAASRVTINSDICFICRTLGLSGHSPTKRG
jgi:hypothetical protein